MTAIPRFVSRAPPAAKSRCGRVQTPGIDLKEVWFPGTHCDVGGGFPEADNGMSKYPLAWMAREASATGLEVDDTRLGEVLGLNDNRFSRADPKARRHNSMTLLWALLEFVPKKHWNHDKQKWEWRMNLFRRRTLPANPVVHSVAWQIPSYAETLPPGARPL